LSLFYLQGIPYYYIRVELTMKTVSDIGERGLIRIISDILGGLGNDILSGEDDAVAIHIRDPSLLVINTDMLVSTTDVPPQMNFFQAARKAVVMTVSDVLVKGAIPKWGVVALGIDKNLPLDGDRGFTGLIRGLQAGFKEYGVQYLGGDLNETKEIIISCTIFGEAPYGIIPRSGAKSGDLIVCTGELGKTGCGFSILLNQNRSRKTTDENISSFIDSVLHPNTSTQYAHIIIKNKWATSSCDSSDGILETIKEICKASKTGAKLTWNSLPIAAGVEQFSQETGEDIFNLILNSGEEFIHIFTIPKDNFLKSLKHFNTQNLLFTKIGEITSNERVIMMEYPDKTIDISKFSGFIHLKKNKK